MEPWGSRSGHNSRSSEKGRKKGQELLTGGTWELEEREESEVDLQFGVWEEAGGGHGPRSPGLEAMFWGRGGVWGFGYKGTGFLVVGEVDTRAAEQAELLVTEGELSQ